VLTTVAVEKHYVLKQYACL